MCELIIEETKDGDDNGSGGGGDGANWLVSRIQIPNEKITSGSETSVCLGKGG